MNPPYFLKLLVVTFFICFSTHPLAFAQDANYLEDEGSGLWEEQQFLDVTGEEFTTDDAQYVGDEEVKAAKEAARRSGIPSIDLAAALERDKEMLPDNIMYGIGTGALIGGWFALVEGGDARENVRYLTVGTLVGALLGMAIGYKSLFTSQDPGVASLSGTPKKNDEGTISAFGIRMKPDLVVTPKFAKLNLQVRF